MAQVAPPDTATQRVPYSERDTMKVGPAPLAGDTVVTNPDTLGTYLPPPAIAPESLAAETLQTTEMAPTVYHERVYISKGPADEVKEIPTVFVISPGPIGSPAIGVEYLNVSDVDITLNGLPFPYQGLYRPYVIGTDLNTIPWELLNEIRWNPKDFVDGLDFRIGRPSDNANRSDIDVGRGPYGYEAARWRFFRPFGKKIYGYFTVGFKKSTGYLQNSDYDGFHVTGGVSYRLKNGLIALDLWQHQATMGVNSFDYIPAQTLRQKRTIDRGELRYTTRVMDKYPLAVTGLVQRNDQKITGYGNDINERYTIAGGQAVISDSTDGRAIKASLHYYRLILSRLGKFPIVNDIEPAAAERGKYGPIDYDLRLAYDWNNADKGIILPSARLSYKISPRLSPFAEILRSRRLPDLNLRYFNDNVSGLNGGSQLQSYIFTSNFNLSMPVTNQATLGLESDLEKMKAAAGVSLKKVASQIFLSYKSDGAGNFVVTPTNFDDTFMEIFAAGSGESGPFSGEISGAYRIWSKRFFPDNLEKGPAALGSARLSFLKQFFIPRLYLGGSLEARFSTRRDYRSITTGFTGALTSLSGRLEFRYKDLTIWLNDENLTNAAYSTWWPYLETPRIVWLGFMWNFFD